MYIVLSVAWKLSPGGGEDQLQPFYHLREEDQGLGVVLHRVRHAFSCSCHLLPEELDVSGAALHGAGSQLHRRPQLVQTLLLGELHRGDWWQVHHTVWVHGAWRSSVDVRTPKPGILGWLDVLIYTGVVGTAETQRRHSLAPGCRN